MKKTLKKMDTKTSAKATSSIGGEISATDISKLSIRLVKDKLSVGDAYKQNDLCRLLGQPIFKNKNQKETQKKTFRRFFDFEEDDGYLVINCIYDIMQPKIPRKVRSNSAYAQYMQYLLMNYLYMQEGNVATMTRRKWWIILNMINQNYEKLFSDNDEDKKWIKNIGNRITDEEIEHFKSRTLNKYYHVFNDILKAMEDKRFIITEKVFMVGTDWDDLHIANDDEKELWLEAEQLALRDVNWRMMNDAKDPTKYRNLERVSQIYYQDIQYQDLFHQLKDKHKNELCGWKISYQMIKIVFTKFGMKQKIEHDAELVPYWRKQMNHNFEFFFNKQIINELKMNHLIEEYEDLNTKDLLNDERIMQNIDNIKLYNELSLTDQMIVV